jgi:peptide-methionine (S)-S-oxide reductase
VLLGRAGGLPARPARVSFDQLLEVFFSVAHDPTELDRQGPDVGPQYRSAIWTTSGGQARAVRSYIARLDRSRVFGRPIVTKVNPLRGFYPAETYHQDYLIHHPDQPYIRINDLPKLERLRKAHPELWRDRPAPWRMEASSSESS